MRNSSISVSLQDVCSVAQNTDKNLHKLVKRYAHNKAFNIMQQLQSIVNTITLFHKQSGNDRFSSVSLVTRNIE